MFPAPRTSLRTATPLPAPDDVAHLRVVDADTYTDWELYRDKVDRLYRLIYSRVGNRPDAEDLTSEVFRTALGPMRLTSKGEVRLVPADDGQDGSRFPLAPSPGNARYLHRSGGRRGLSRQAFG